MFSGASTFVEGVDKAFIVIFGISLVFLVGITALMIYFVIRYRRKKNPKAQQVNDSNWLEITWTVIPFILVMIMFYYGYKGFTPMRNVPDNAITIKAIGYMWDWRFEYEGGKEYNELIVPINQAIKLELVSLDVIHSLYIPAFRVKEDMVPGKDDQYLWFEAQKEGVYEVLCAEYCGLRHSFMETKARVVPREEYDRWLAELPVQKPGEDPPGLQVIKANACIGCHSLDGTRLVGASFKGLYGSTRLVVTDGESREVTADDQYIRDAIYEPNRDLVEGFPKGQMNSYEDLITEEQLGQIIEYLKTLK